MNNSKIASCCARCGVKNQPMTCSRFNVDWICMECQKKERAHPDYERAVEAELKAVQSGDYNYKGIGKPTDL